MMTQNLPELTAQIVRKIDLIVIHCSATVSGRTISPPQKNAAQVIDDWHSARGFKRDPQRRLAFNPSLAAIGYHYVIDIDGSIFSGRSLEEVGAHAKGFNAHSIGICLIGGRERDAQYTSAQWQALAQLTQALAHKFNIPLCPPLLKAGHILKRGICGHRDLSPDLNSDGIITPNEWTKTCPGFSVFMWLAAALKPEPQNIYEGTP